MLPFYVKLLADGDLSDSSSDDDYEATRFPHKPARIGEEYQATELPTVGERPLADFSLPPQNEPPHTKLTLGETSLVLTALQYYGKDFGRIAKLVDRLRAEVVDFYYYFHKLKLPPSEVTPQRERISTQQMPRLPEHNYMEVSVRGDVVRSEEP